MTDRVFSSEEKAKLITKEEIGMGTRMQIYIENYI